MYGYNAPDEPIQLVNLRVTAIGQLGGNYIAQKATSSSATLDQARTAYREVFFRETGKTRCPIYDRGVLPIGIPVPGPAVIQEANSTIVVYPGQSARATEWGTVEITLAG